MTIANLTDLGSGYGSMRAVGFLVRGVELPLPSVIRDSDDLARGNQFQGRMDEFLSSGRLMTVMVPDTRRATNVW